MSDAARLGRQPRLFLLELAALACVAWLALAGAPGIGAWTLGAVALALVVGLPLVRCAGLADHPQGQVRAASWLDALSVIGALSAWALGVPLAWVLGAYALGVTAAFQLGQSGLARFRAAAPRRTVKLSAAIICRNEVDRLEPCLQALSGWADEIIVLDSGSTDGTQALARRYTDKVFETDWPGYGPQKQRALEKCTGEWVLSLDADEVISADLKREIDGHLAMPTRHAAFRFPWVSVIFGGPIHFGADGRYHTRLFRRDAARFDAAQVHEEAVVQGRVGTLWAPVYHHTFRDFAHLKQKFAEYAWLSAKSRHAKGRSVTAVGAVLRGCASFLLLYFVRLGVLDGRRGLLMAVLYAHYTFDKYAALWALNRSASRRAA